MPRRAKRQIRAGPTTATAVSSRCSPTWSWNCQNPALKKYIEELKHKRGVQHDAELTTEDLQSSSVSFKAFYTGEDGRRFPRRNPASSCWRP